MIELDFGAVLAQCDPDSCIQWATIFSSPEARVGRGTDRQGHAADEDLALLLRGELILGLFDRNVLLNVELAAEDPHLLLEQLPRHRLREVDDAEPLRLALCSTRSY